RNTIAGELFGFGRNWGGLGRYYRMYQQVMAHWRQVLPAGVMYEIDYEELVANPEVEARKLLDFCDLEWNDGCLEFYKAKNRVNTTSFAQVRRPMYKDSVSGWRRYEKQLEPLINILGIGDS
ncbi:MAG: sulfotransferase, partial [Mariprofundales bacterium]